MYSAMAAAGTSRVRPTCTERSRRPAESTASGDHPEGTTNEGEPSCRAGRSPGTYGHVLPLQMFEAADAMDRALGDER